MVHLTRTVSCPTYSSAAARVIAFRPLGSRSRRPLTCDVALCGDRIRALSRGRDLVLVALGELLEVEQLPPGHDQVANAQPERSPAGGPQDNLEQQTGHVVLVRDQHVGHEGAHDGAGQLLAGIDRDDPAQFTPASGSEPIPGLRLREANEAPG